MKYGKALIDGDVFAYRAAFATNDSDQTEARVLTDSILQIAIETVVGWPWEQDDYQVYLTCSGYQFRHDIAKTHVYKGNRKSKDKPVHLQYIRDHMIENWGAEVSIEQEADDCLAIEATQLDYDCTIVSVDKDMMQVPCWHHNPVKGTMTKVTPDEGIKFFYTQMLTGDAADNIVGLQGIGPKKAEKILQDVTTEDDLWDTVLKAYEGDVDRAVENARLLWLRRYEGEIWQPPDMR
jgi:hypothetical protein